MDAPQWRFLERDSDDWSAGSSNVPVIKQGALMAEELADRCPEQEYFLHVLYLLVGDAVRSGYSARDRLEADLEARRRDVLAEGGPSPGHGGSASRVRRIDNRENGTRIDSVAVPNDTRVHRKVLVAARSLFVDAENEPHEPCCAQSAQLAWPLRGARRAYPVGVLDVAPLKARLSYWWSRR
jgi:hypothetical protein